MFSVKLKRCITGIVLFVFILAIAILFIPYFSYDPRLEIIAYRLRPIVAKIEEYNREHGTYPSKLKDVGIDEGKRSNGLSKITYLAETGFVGKNEIDFEVTSSSDKKIGFEIYIENWCGALFYENTSLSHGWYFNFGESEMKLNL